MQRSPTIEEQRTFYDKWNTQCRRGCLDEIDREISIRGLAACEVLRRLNLNKPRILEVGCGTGWLTEKLCFLGDLTAIDLSPQAIAIALGRNITAEFISADFYEYEFRPPSFDAVVCAETLFYVVDQPRFIEKLASLIRTDAYLVLTTINKFVYDRRSEIGPPEQGQVRSWLSQRQIRKLLAPHFKVLSIATIEPRGDLGLLRLVNSYKLNRFLGKLFSPDAIKYAKEKMGLGGGIIILAQKIN
jgi:2-polyprenyl-3-methyl-5-hydroxy-6-metoxy-1,4-benzoquinol methylase